MMTVAVSPTCSKHWAVSACNKALAEPQNVSSFDGAPWTSAAVPCQSGFGILDGGGGRGERRSVAYSSVRILEPF
jgi:hypothetical protein